MWMYVLYFTSLSDKKDAEFWITYNVGYFEFDAYSHEDGSQFSPRLKFYTSSLLPEAEQATIKQATRATSFLAEEL